MGVKTDFEMFWECKTVIEKYHERKTSVEIYWLG